MSNNWQMNKQTLGYIRIMEGYSAMKKKELLIQLSKNMTAPQKIILSERKRTQETKDLESRSVIGEGINDYRRTQWNFLEWQKCFLSLCLWLYTSIKSIKLHR